MMRRFAFPAPALAVTRAWSLPPALAAMALLLSCVTINIYFPAAAAERAADRIIKEILEAEEGIELPPEARRGAAMPLPLARLAVLLPAAQAQEADFDISTPAIDALRARMKTRHGALAPYYASGAIGYDDQGNVAIRDLAQVPLRERQTVQRLVSEENRDRADLYAEIAEANGHPEWTDEVRQTFATRWIANAPGSFWIRKGGQWTR